MRLVLAKCSADYNGRLRSHLPVAVRLIIVKADGSVLVHSDGGSYKPLNWMPPPCTLEITTADGLSEEQGASSIWKVRSRKNSDFLTIRIHEILLDHNQQLGIEPGLTKDGVESELQNLLSEQIELLGKGFRLIAREYFTAIGPVDILAVDSEGNHVAVEIKRRGELEGVEQLSRYLNMLNRDPKISPVSGIFAAQEIKKQARTLAEDRNIRCVILDYDEMRGADDTQQRLF